MSPPGHYGKTKRRLFGLCAPLSPEKEVGGTEYVLSKRGEGTWGHFEPDVLGLVKGKFKRIVANEGKGCRIQARKEGGKNRKRRVPGKQVGEGPRSSS